MEEQTFNLLSIDDLVSQRAPYNIVRGIYFVFSDDEIIYIGQSINIVQRVAFHFVDTRFRHTPPTTYAFVEVPGDQLDLMEMLYINKFRPRYNVKGLK